MRKFFNFFMTMHPNLLTSLMAVVAIIVGLIASRSPLCLLGLFVLPLLSSQTVIPQEQPEDEELNGEYDGNDENTMGFVNTNNIKVEN